MEEESLVQRKGLAERRFGEKYRPGVHAVSYYYSDEHLLVKSAYYIQQGIRSGEKCLIGLEPMLHEKFYRLLQRMGVDVVRVQSRDQLQLFPFFDLYEIYRSGGLDALIPMVQEMLEEAWEEGFSGIRILGEANYGIWGVDPENCFKWESDFDQMVLQLPLKTLCLYNLQDLMQMIQEKSSFILSTIQSHRFIYNGGQTINSEDFVNQVLEGVS